MRESVRHCICLKGNQEGERPEFLPGVEVKLELVIHSFGRQGRSVQAPNRQRHDVPYVSRTCVSKLPGRFRPTQLNSILGTWNTFKLMSFFKIHCTSKARARACRLTQPAIPMA